MIFSLDGSFPTTSSEPYLSNGEIRIEKPITSDIALIPTSDVWETPNSGVTNSAILRVAAYDGDERVSEVLNQSFWLSDNPHTMPIISLVGEKNDFFDETRGIYVKGESNNYFQEGKEWERPIHVSFFNADGIFNFDQTAGIRLGGAKTREEPQKTMRLYARSSYGNSHFEHPFWGKEYGDRFKRITLRTLNADPWSSACIMDDLIHQIIDGEVTADYVRRNFAVVYLNGVYWGIHSMREHNNQHYVERVYGVAEDEVTIARAKLRDSGQNNSFDKLVNDITFLDLRDSLNYQELVSRLDIEQYTDYIITNLAFANRDWPQNNVEYWSSDAFDGKVRFIINDLDATMLIHNDERLDLFIVDQAKRLERDRWTRVLIFLQKLLEVPEYRAYFTQRFNRLLRTSFAPDRTIGILNDMTADLQAEMESHIKRWHFPSSLRSWERALERLETFLLRRPLYLIERSNELFGFPITVYPNPVQDHIFIEFDAWDDGTLHLELFDINGSLIMKSSKEVSEGIEKIEINLKNVAPGSCILRANFKGMQINQRILKVEN